MRDVMLANSPLQPEVMQELEDRKPPLTPHVMNQIRQAQEGTLEREKLERKIARLEFEQGSDFADGIYRYWQVPLQFTHKPHQQLINLLIFGQG